MRSAVIARPDELATEPAVQRWVELVLTEEALERLEIRTGIRPAELTELVRADFGEDRIVWLLRNPGDTPALVRAAEMRMSTVEERGEDPLRRTGHIGARRRTWVALSDDTLLVASGHLEAEIAALVEAARRARVSASALAGPPEDEPWTLDRLPPTTAGGYFLADSLASYREHRESPLLLIVPEALGLSIDSGVGMLLARQRRLTATATPAGDALRLHLVLEGEFPAGADANFRSLFESVARSDLGRATGADVALDTFELVVREGRVEASASWPASGWARGVALLGGQDPWVWVDGG